MVLAILLTIAFTILFTTAFSMLLKTYNPTQVPSIGTIQALGVQTYGGDILNTTTTPYTQYLDWGTLYPGAQINRTFYVKSTSNLNVILTLNTTNWTPTNMSNYMNLTWNYSGITLTPGQVILVTLTLSVSSSTTFINYLITNNIQNFNFDINIKPIEH